MARFSIVFGGIVRPSIVMAEHFATAYAIAEAE